MATQPDIQIEETAPPKRDGTSPSFPELDKNLPGSAKTPPNVVQLYMNQCVEGGWQRDTADGRTMLVNTTFNYVINLEFENAEQAKTFMAREDINEISNTMTKTMEAMAQETLGLEILRDFLPESYPDGQVPDNVHNQLTPNSIDDMNIVASEFARVMSASYPNLGLVGATVDEGSINQLPGCYYGIPDDKASAPATIDNDVAGAGLDTRSKTFTF